VPANWRLRAIGKHMIAIDSAAGPRGIASVKIRLATGRAAGETPVTAWYGGHSRKYGANAPRDRSEYRWSHTCWSQFRV